VSHRNWYWTPVLLISDLKITLDSAFIVFEIWSRKYFFGNI
jgi:hypothetical protein